MLSARVIFLVSCNMGKKFVCSHPIFIFLHFQTLVLLDSEHGVNHGHHLLHLKSVVCSSSYLNNIMFYEAWQHCSFNQQLINQTWVGVIG